MASQIWDRKVVTASGLTGTNNVTLQPFDFSTYGITTIVRCSFDIDILAVPTVLTTVNGYGEYFCGEYIFDYKVTGGVSGALVANNLPLNNGTNIHWFPQVSGAGNFQVVAAGQATTLTWSIVMACTIRNWIERP